MLEKFNDGILLNFILFAADNGFNPIWNENCEFFIINPDFGLLRFEVQDEDIFGESNFIGQATFPASQIFF